ncbi:MAG: hypothetical protein AAB443_02265 [Patescibacteria group bacterium]
MKIKSLLLKSTILLFLTYLFFIPSTSSYYADTEFTEENNLSALTLDLSLKKQNKKEDNHDKEECDKEDDDESDDNEDNDRKEHENEWKGMDRRDGEEDDDCEEERSKTKAETLIVKNEGLLDFYYNLEIKDIVDNSYCSNAKLKIFLDEDNTALILYDGLLTNVIIDEDQDKVQLELKKGNKQQFNFTVTTFKKSNHDEDDDHEEDKDDKEEEESEEGEHIINKKCSFKVIAKAWLKEHSFDSSYSDLEDTYLFK